jgi:putative endonuclease
MPFWVYILQNETTGKLYKGQTSDLEKRIERHNTDESGSRTCIIDKLGLFEY